MTASRCPRRVRRGGIVLLTLAVLAAACGDDDGAGTLDASPASDDGSSASDDGSSASDDGSSASDDGSSVSATTTAADCSGEPIKLTTIISMTGPLAFPSRARDVEQGATAALHAVNSDCRIGRPLEIEHCDEKSDPNESLACGRAAAADGSLAIFGDSGLFEDGITASGLPAVFPVGASAFDLTNEMSYPASDVVVLVLGSLSAAAASGADNYLMVAIDSQVAHFLIDQLSELAEDFGIEMEGLYFPPDTTDFAPVAAQIADRAPDAIGMIVPPIVPFLNAMDAEGISPLTTPMFTAVSVVPPEVIDEVGNKIDGLHLITQALPPQDQDNEGIQQMLAEYEAAGIDTDVADMGTGAVEAWSKVHLVADALEALDPAAIDSLDSEGLIDAVVALGPVTRPEMAPFDLSTPAFPEDPVLSGFRIFSREAAVVRVDGGAYVPVSDFGDVTEPIEMVFAD